MAKSFKHFRQDYDDNADDYDARRTEKDRREKRKLKEKQKFSWAEEPIEDDRKK